MESNYRSVRVTIRENRGSIGMGRVNPPIEARVVFVNGTSTIEKHKHHLLRLAVTRSSLRNARTWDDQNIDGLDRNA